MTTHPNPDALPQGTRIGRTALRVNDLEGMTRFYRDVVGLSVLCQSDTAAVLGVEDTPLLILEGDENALERHNSETGLFHTAFRVPSREALGGALARIRGHWRLDGASDHEVSEALYLTDPEGNGVEIYRDFPRDAWPLTDDGSVRIGTYPLDLEPLEAAAESDSSAPAGTDVGHIHLEVSSLETFQEFYVDVVGFEIRTIVPAAVFVSAGGYHHHLGANTWNHRSDPVSGTGLSWFEVILPESGTLEEVRARIADTHYTVIEMDDGISVIGPDAIEVRFHVETSLPDFR